MQYLKADTITEVVIGPAVAVGDGFVPVTGLVGSTADEFEIIKHGATTTTTIVGTLAAITGADGYYALDLSATDTNTEGRLTLLINDDSLILPIRHEFMVVNANVFDSLFAAAGTDLLQIDQTEIVGTTVPAPATAGIPDVNVQEWIDAAPLGLTSGRVNVNVQTMGSNVITASIIAPDAIGASELAAGGCNKIADHAIRRTFANAQASSDGDTKNFRSLLGAIGKLVNKVSISGSTLTITEEDDTTSLGTQTITTDAAADPITAVDTV